jgi:DNA-binding response OmpR family regulator
VDDNRDFVEFLNLLLSRDGFAVRRAFDGASGSHADATRTSIW